MALATTPTNDWPILSARKYYSSVLNLRDFLADNIGQSFVGVVAKAIDDRYLRYNH